MTAGPSVADEKVTRFCEKLPLREVMRQLSRPFGYTWLRSKREGGDYRYELVQDPRSQLLEEELRNRDRNATLVALEREIDRYRPYLGLSPNEALGRAQRAPAAEKPLGETMRLRWRLEGENATLSGAEKRWLQIRSATYYQDRLKEVPNRLLTHWAAARRRHVGGGADEPLRGYRAGPQDAGTHEVGRVPAPRVDGLPLDDLVEIAGLSDAQLDGEEMRQGAVEWWGIPEWSLLHSRDFRPHVRFLAEFTPEQRRMMMSAEGLPFGKMSLAQQQGFLSYTINGEPIRSFDELAGATLRVDYTQPGAFQWQKAGGFTPTRWVVRVESGPAGRRVLIPPIRERTREAALAAARRAFPPITPSLQAAFRQSDPALDANQILPQPNQIFPTELDLVVVYVPGTATERGIRWFRIGQGPLVGDGG